MAWRIEVSRPAERELAKLDPASAQRILTFLRRRVLSLDHPRMLGSALKGPEFGHLWKYRVGDFRIIVSIEDDALLILVATIGNRREVYR